MRRPALAAPIAAAQSFAKNAADYLQSRVDYTLNQQRLEGVVNTFYQPNLALNTFAESK